MGTHSTSLPGWLPVKPEMGCPTYVSLRRRVIAALPDQFGRFSSDVQVFHACIFF